MNNESKQSNFLTIFFIGLTCIFIGGFIGAVTNMINGLISPNYFRIIMGWDFQDIWIGSVAQGIFEGLIYGIIFSLIFTTGFGIITKGNGKYNFALRQLFKIILIIFSFWAFGGIIAILLASLSPEFYQSHFYNVPEEKTEMLKYAWVGGSIWGGIIGGLLSAIFGVVIIKNNWKDETE
jgi:prolipoprotein diacylglyceryltransferase